MNILLIGGNGKLGREIIKTLKLDAKITIISRKKNNEVNSKQIICDYQNLNEIGIKLDKYYDYIINLLPYSSHSIKKEFKILKNRFNKYIFFSSFAVYKENIKKIDENSELLKKTSLPYINRKIEYEKFLKNNQSINSIIIRPTHIFSKNSLPSIYTKKSNTILNFINKYKKIISPIDWNAKRNFISAKNVAYKLRFVLKNKYQKKYYNFSSNLDLSWGHLFKIYSNKLGCKNLIFLKNSEKSLKQFDKNLLNDLRFDKGKNLLIKKNFLTKQIKNYDNKRYFISNIDKYLNNKDYNNKNYYDKGLEKYFLHEISMFSGRQKQSK